MAGRQLPFFSLLVPVWLVAVMAGFRATLEVWPALLVCGGSFAAVQFLTANFHGPWLVDVAGGLVSLVSLALFLKVWHPRTIWHFADEQPTAKTPVIYPRADVVRAWLPWVLLTIFVFVWGLPAFKAAMAPTVLKFPVPGLHQQVAREPPVVPDREIEQAVYTLNLGTAAGTSIFLAAIVSSFFLGITPVRFARVLGATLVRMRWPLFTIGCMLAIAYTTRYSGMDATLGLAFTRTGWIYPLFAALLGWLGVALTGSDTSANALFGSLQTITARRLSSAGILPLSAEQASILLASANSVGGVMGKMIDAQSIVVAAAATGQHGGEGPILRFVFWHSLILAILMGLFVLAQAYWWSWMIPAMAP
jgi:lactate permease